jgi:L-rhamnose-H+ transport protein
MLSAAALYYHVLHNYMPAALAGAIWYFQFFFYSVGQTK